MRILTITFGSTGDVRPYVALGCALKSRGHEVTIATHGSFGPFIREHGIGFYPLSGDPRQILASKNGQRWLSSQGNPLAFLWGLRRVAVQLAERCGIECREATRDTEAIIASRLGMSAGLHLAEKYRIPLIPAYLQPLSPTRAFPDVYVFPRDMTALPNYLSHCISNRIFWSCLHRQTNTFRSEILSLPRLSVRQILHRVRTLQGPKLYAVSPAVVPKPTDWHNDHHMTGYWFCPVRSWKPPQELCDFLAAGPPPVCVGFGSMIDRDPQQLSDIVLECLRRSGQRGIFLTGWGGLNLSAGNSRVFVAESVPHEWLFPRVSLVVHHGGVGTMAETLRAGVVSITVPFFADQLYWGNRLQKLGVGTKPIPRRRLTIERLHQAMNAALHNGAMRVKARDIAGHIATENGIEQAATLIDRYLAGNTAQPSFNRISPRTVQLTSAGTEAGGKC